MLSPVQTEETLGEAEVRALFKVSRLGTIAGCMVTHGVVRRNARVRVVRDGTVIYETSIAQLKRFKDDAREVSEGFECGILLDGFNDVKEGDVLEAFETREVERTDLDTPSASPSAHAAPKLARPSAAEATPSRLEQVSGEARHACRSRMPTGFVGILRFELFFPESHSLKEKRMHLRSRQGSSSRTASAARSPRSTITTRGSGRGSRSPA